MKVAPNKEGTRSEQGQEDRRIPADKLDAVWSPQPGPQALALTCPADIIFFGGARGGGKTDCAIGRQLRGAMVYGEAWSGLFVRKNFKHFKELRRRIDELINRGLDAKRSGGDQATNIVRFDNGASIIFTAIQYETQLEYFQGQQYTELSIEEGCQFPFIDNMIEMLKGCLRSPHGVPTHMFITGNPGGPGHGQVKARFISPAPPGTPIKDEGGDICMFIPSSVEDNKVLVENDPKYVRMLKSIRNPELRKAWLEGDWDVVAGGFFSDLWQPHKLIVRPFQIPKHWDRVMGFDWGSAKPFSVGWWAVSGGEFLPELGRALPRGSLVRYYEWYGCVKGQPDVGLRLNSANVAKRILELEERYSLVPNGIIDRIADPAVFKQEDGKSVGESMADHGVVFRRGDNKRVPGWDAMRSYMRGVEVDRQETEDENGELVVEFIEYQPQMYVFETCTEFIRTVPILARDDHDYEDIDTTQEDHAADEARYVCMSRQGKGTSELDKRDVPTATERDHAVIAGMADTDEQDFDPEMELPANIAPEEIQWADYMLEVGM